MKNNIKLATSILITFFLLREIIRFLANGNHATSVIPGWNATIILSEWNLTLVTLLLILAVIMIVGLFKLIQTLIERLVKS